jgi:hypothetical protein
VWSRPTALASPSLEMPWLRGSMSISMAKRRTVGTTSSAPRKVLGREPRPGIVHTSVYLPEGAYEALRETAFHERRKIHDLIIEGIGLALRKRGYPPIEDVKAGKRG